MVADSGNREAGKAMVDIRGSTALAANGVEPMVIEGREVVTR